MIAEQPEGPPPRPASVGGRASRRVLLSVLSVALFVAIVWFGGMQSWRTVMSGDLLMYGLAFVLSGIVPALSAWRLQTLVRAATGHHVAPWRRFFHVNMTGIALGIVLPRNAALLGGKAAYLKALDVPLLRGSWAVLAENLADLFFLSIILVPCLLVVVAGVGAGSFMAATIGCLAVLFGVVLWTRGRDWRAVMTSMLGRVPLVRSRLAVLDGGFVPGPVRGLPLFGVTILVHALLALRSWVIALAIGVEGGSLLFVAVYPLAQLSLVLAVAPGALGTLDASWLGLLLLGGLSNPEALSFTVAQRACIVVFPLVWYAVSFLLTLTLPDRDGLPGSVADPSTVS